MTNNFVEIGWNKKKTLYTKLGNHTKLFSTKIEGHTVMSQRLVFATFIFAIYYMLGHDKSKLRFNGTLATFINRRLPD